MLESCQGRGLMQGHCAGMNFSLSHTSGRSPRDQHTVDPSLRSTSGSGLGLWLSSLGQLTRCMFLGCFGFRGWGLRILKAAGAGQLYIYVSQTRDVDASTFCKDKLDVETFLLLSSTVIEPTSAGAPFGGLTAKLLRCPRMLAYKDDD